MQIKFSKLQDSTIRWIMTWVFLSILPMIPFTLPLFQVSLANSPIAYLIWTPVLAFSWAVWNLHRISSYQNNRTKSLWMGCMLLLITGFFLFFGKNIWPSFFVFHFGGLFLWPLWSIGMLWILFGIGATKAVLKPMIYLLLVWPPIYLTLLTYTNPLLKKITLSAVNSYRDAVIWMHAGTESGVIVVQSNTGWFSIAITNACSGSDSTLALLLLFPIILVVFRLSTRKKALLVAGGLLLTVVFNIIRIDVILFATHYIGASFALNFLHPLLGPVLFFFLIFILMLLGSKNVKPTAGKKRGNLSLPNRTQFITALIVTIVMTLLLLPRYFDVTPL